MNVGELIEELQKLPKETVVVIARDEEGNGFCELGTIDDNACYLDGEVRMRELTDDAKRQGFTEEDLGGPEFEPCVTLWP